MAKPRRHRRKNQPTTFFESLPAAAIAPVGLPQVHAELAQVSREVHSVLKRWLRYLQPSLQTLTRDSSKAGLATYMAIEQGYRHLRLTLNYSLDAVITYGPAIAEDVETYAARTARTLVSRRARLSYVLLVTGGVIAGVVGVSVIATTTIKAYAHDISSPAALLDKKKTGTTILDRNGVILFQGYGAQTTARLRATNIPTTLKNATLAAEDPSFYDHPGFSWRGTARAIYTDLTHQSRMEGGSTLTQQLVKNAILTTDKSITRKAKEILLANELEKHYSKDEILGMYLNETYYGQSSSGIEDASQAYFHKTAENLTLGESALLAGLPLGPSRLDPNVDLPAATGRRNFVLSRMADLGKISPEQAAAAKAQPLVLADTPEATDTALVVYAKTITIQAPHFVFYVLDQLRAQYGETMIESGGITVKTTLDMTKQNLAQTTVTTQINKLADHHVTNGGLISLEPKTGAIVAMVGSTDYNAPGFGNVNVTLSDLQPGSSFKPIAYATAFVKGWNGATIIDDAPFSAPSGDGTTYTPENYDLRFHGKVTVRRALDNSLNIPAVKTLKFAGIPETIQTAHDLGITTLSNPSTYGLALVLGGGEVRPIDMATVYATFANSGVKVMPRSIVQVTDRYGNDITKSVPSPPKPVLDPRVAYMITNILSDDSSRQPEFPSNGPLTLPGRPVAAKTGTTNDFRDNWTVGYTPQLATAVWVGNNDHTAMNNVDGITGAAPIWHDYMTSALADVPATAFAVPAGITAAKVCAADGGLANPWDLGYTEIFKSDAIPSAHCATSAPVPVASPTPSPSSEPVPPPADLPTPPPIKFPHIRNPFN